MDPEQVIAQMRAQGASEADVEAYLRSTGAEPVADPNAALHAQFKSGALAKNQADKNAADTVDWRNYADILPQTVNTFIAGIPGAKLAVSAARARMTGRPLPEVQNEVNAETSDVPFWSGAAKAVGLLGLTPMLPMSGAASGAILGGATGLLSNDPNATLGGRLAGGAVGAAGGAVVGNLADKAVTAARAALSPVAEQVRNGMLAQRAAQAKALFTKALSEGKNGATETQPILDFLTSPDIAPIVADLKASRTHANTDEFSPEMLDAVYKVLSDRGLVAKSKLAALVPRNANIGRVAANDITLAKQQALDAMSRGPNAPMPTYETAVKNFADNSRGIGAFDTGYDALRSTMGGNLVPAKSLSRADRTSGSFADWLASVAQKNPEDVQNAANGITSGVRSAKSMKAVNAAAKLLRPADRARGLLLPNYAQKALPAGLLAALGQ